MELVMSLPVFIVITIFSINAAAFVFAADFCDRACKDCARAAGQMSTPDEAVNAMNAAASAHPTDNYFFQQLSPQLLVYQDYNYSTTTPTPAYHSTSAYSGTNGANDITPTRGEDESKKDKRVLPNIGKILADPNQTITPGPYVIVRTSMLLHIPVSINLFGYRVFGGNVENNPELFKLESTYTFPITNTYVPI